MNSWFLIVSHASLRLVVSDIHNYENWQRQGSAESFPLGST